MKKENLESGSAYPTVDEFGLTKLELLSAMCLQARIQSGNVSFPNGYANKTAHQLLIADSINDAMELLKQLKNENNSN